MQPVKKLFGPVFQFSDLSDVRRGGCVTEWLDLNMFYCINNIQMVRTQ